MNKFFFILLALNFLPICIAQNNIHYCKPEADLQKCIDDSNHRTISLDKGIYLVEQIKLPSDITFIIPKGATIKLSDKAYINSNTIDGSSNSVLSAIGTLDKPVENLHIILHGAIDGNKQNHPYEKGGVEGIDIKHIKNSSISGDGIITSANHDGLDIDAAEDLIIRDITIKNNGGTGLHFGSPRPIIGSFNNIVINVTATLNGFERQRNGIDLSWPNENGAIFINCISIDNYRNYEIEAEGGIVINSHSIDNGNVIKEDIFTGSIYTHVNNKNITNKAILSKKTKILLKRDIKDFFGIEYEKHLEGVKY